MSDMEIYRQLTFFFGTEALLKRQAMRQN